ncbi:sialyltransferase [Chloropicon primus]|uniref:Sialyltransferase n=1 Tax=Chloropicon primus TaxID=1764295 RepID=A0A5B8MW85_9CHLO|nr:sialyltransferase [Chloropicon primus]UPR04008.1 sialyltransferase [Chloropicon primus]|eukprot:QDZ24799.1 sialyltransferase [Chloropicon primus]
MVRFDSSDLAPRRLIIYLLVTLVTVGIFFAHDTLVNHAHNLNTSGQHFHVDERFWGKEKLQEQKISVNGEFTYKELNTKVKKLKEEHKKKKVADVQSVSAPVGGPASSSSASSSSTSTKKVSGLHPGTAKDLEHHRSSNPTFAIKDPYEEKCSVTSLEERVARPFNDSFVSAKDEHRYRSNFKVPKYWPLHMRGNNICKHIKWQVVGQVNNKALKVFPATDFIKERLRRSKNKFGTCAVVGNGGGTLLKEYGKYIDAHDTVIRFNGGPTVGFEKHVGSRTSFRVTNSEHFFFHEKHTNETVLQHITNSKNFKQLFKISERASLRDVLPNLKVIDPFFQYYVLNLHNDGAPSNGFYGIALAHLICTQITLFGYQKDWRHQKIPYHYYDKVEPNTNQYGRDTRETVRFEELLQSINDVAYKDQQWLAWREEAQWPMGKVVTGEEYVNHMVSEDLKESHGAWESQVPPLEVARNGQQESTDDDDGKKNDDDDDGGDEDEGSDGGNALDEEVLDGEEEEEVEVDESTSTDNDTDVIGSSDSSDAIEEEQIVDEGDSA